MRYARVRPSGTWRGTGERTGTRARPQGRTKGTGGDHEGRRDGKGDGSAERKNVSCPTIVPGALAAACTWFAFRIIRVPQDTFAFFVSRTQPYIARTDTILFSSARFRFYSASRCLFCDRTEENGCAGERKNKKRFSQRITDSVRKIKAGNQNELNV